MGDPDIVFCESTNWFMYPPPPNRELAGGWFGGGESARSCALRAMWERMAAVWSGLSIEQRKNYVARFVQAKREP
jgi:hypothetical protein